MSTIDQLWQRVADNPTDAEAKRDLAGRLGDSPERDGLLWAAGRGKCPRHGRADGHGPEFWRWMPSGCGMRGHELPRGVYEVVVGTHPSIRGDFPTLPDAFAALGKALRELREIVREEPTQ